MQVPNFTAVKSVEKISDKKIKQITENMGEAYNKMTSPKFISGLAMNIGYFAIMIFVNFALVSFSLEKIQTTSFWTNIALNVLLLFLAYHGTTDMLFDFQEKRQLVINAKNEYRFKNQNTNKSKLEDFLKQFNIETKITFYLSIINRKIAKLKKRLSRKKEETKSYIRLANKILNLKSKKEDKYISDNIEEINVKYPIVYVSDFNEFSYNSDISVLKTKPDFGKNVAKKSIKGAISLIIYTVFFGLLVANYKTNFDSNFWLSLMTMVFIQAMRIFNAAKDLPGTYDSSITITYTSRSEILDSYNKWLNNNPDVVYSKFAESIKEEAKKELREEIKKKTEEISAQNVN